MKIRLLSVICFLLSALVVSGQNDRKDYLRKVLKHLEKIESASYFAATQFFEPGDSISSIANKSFYKEYDNPKDSTIGACFICFDGIETTKAKFGYDGCIRVSADDDTKTLEIDDFSTRRLPFRLISPPFFNYAKNIVKYALETPDNITVTVNKSTTGYHIKIVINEERQVEFFGRAYHLPDNPYCSDPTSIYELWVSKTTDLPYKIRREMSTQISMIECSEVQLNNNPRQAFDVMSFFPQDYEIRKYGEKRNSQPTSDLLLKKAPEWILKDSKGKAVSLADFKSKFLLIQITGIGCGPCRVSIPFLNKLQSELGKDDLGVIAIEVWRKNEHALQNYIDRYGIEYMLLSGTDEVSKEYHSVGSVPIFFLLDENRIIRNVFKGYGEGSTDQKILDAIKLLSHSSE